MRLRTRLSESNFDPETGISTVTLKSKRGIFTGTAKVHPDDKCVQSKFFGFRTAELKAERKLYKEELKREKIALEAIERMQKDLEEHLHDTGSYNDYVMLFTIRKRFYFMRRNHKNNINFLKSEIEEMNKVLKEDKEYLKKIKEKKGSKA